MRRCVEDLHPDPGFPGCIYSEMKMCLAPCFKGCTDEEYGAEVARVMAYFDSRGHSLVREISTQRDQSATDLEFENAAATHERLEKLSPVLVCSRKLCTASIASLGSWCNLVRHRTL